MGEPALLFPTVGLGESLGLSGPWLSPLSRANCRLGWELSNSRPCSEPAAHHGSVPVILVLVHCGCGAGMFAEGLPVPP